MRRLLISGDRANFTTLEFDTTNSELRILADYAAPCNASWTERSCSQGGVDHLIGISEDEKSALVYTFQIDHDQQSCKITSQQETSAGPCHFHALRDGSALVVVTYERGSIVFHPVIERELGQVLLEGSPRTEILPAFRYKAIRHGPNEIRQTQCRIHQILEDQAGRLYAPDFGSDRVWILYRNETGFEICGWLQCPPGSGSRHAVITRDDSLLYVVGELSHDVIAFDLPTVPIENVQPIENFAANIVPPTAHPVLRSMMESGEICFHPTIPNVLYVSNRWERQVAQHEADHNDAHSDAPAGDSVAVILLARDGRSVETIKHVRSNCDVIRGMRISQDGEYAVVVGQESGGVEIYQISGDRGDIWTKTTGLSHNLGIGLKHAIWL